ncbi:unnamed protein product [Arabis nemorensis]|uniref:Uncharacterized protein n=1 Tax=Arabis nemorensis TaxID=586526 RepID=A0A565CLN5_9BRAS|nr:unnamed protein product [Arabis nemorensis]
MASGGLKASGPCRGVTSLWGHQTLVGRLARAHGPSAWPKVERMTQGGASGLCGDSCPCGELGSWKGASGPCEGIKLL